MERTIPNLVTMTPRQRKRSPIARMHRTGKSILVNVVSMKLNRSLCASNSDRQMFS